MRVAVVVPLLFTACLAEETLGPAGAPAAPPPETPPATAPATATAQRPLAPITGGTLLFLRNSPGNLVAAADPDGDRVVVVDLDERRVAHTFALQAGDAPRRMTQLDDGRVAVTLARGAIALFQPTRPDEPIQRIEVCALPRGIAFDGARDRILVACREGKLVEVSRALGTVTRTVELPRDLRDVVVSGIRVFVTRFKSAHVVVLDADLTILREVSPAALPDSRDVASVAYRAVPGPNSSVYVLHQVSRSDLRSVTVEVPPPDPEDDPEVPPPYYAPEKVDCGRSVVAGTVSQVTGNGAVLSSPAFARMVLPVDLALAGADILIADAGSRAGSGASPVRRSHTSIVNTGTGDCDELILGGVNDTDPFALERTGLVTSVAFDRWGVAVALINAPLSIQRGYLRIALSTDVRDATGYRMFHQDSGGRIACASCHPEAEDDGLVWNLPETRRTPALGGGLLDTAPYHWSGDLADFDALITQVFVGRMGGSAPTPENSQALATWLDAVPSIDVPAQPDNDAVGRGAQLFAADCASCHAAPAAASIDVGTGELMQVPPLRGLMFRAPYLHDGSAATLQDRFSGQVGPAHGPQYAPAQVADLVQYLETL